ncbi:FtsJ-like methyltransferase family protein [Aspergillus eucalypticola CBS 122712]|uniref:FtsJ-like methyltransferase family protein n=1 Tax=Aspergillus eucalypticola (strain CBS 122712 / IBT 29274) TaxID=1448314 RepID=A0A317UN42_ASPEC|nr:FtsJ-like methyltransferase family protein [Aspergillus eucalypticola CBS 122712]PWY61987.1 FtsJ-like methyltransferase family protein [Aspergillus eucalypticola CBS 122712]
MRVPEFQRLSELRHKGWKNPAGDQFFEKELQIADNADKEAAKNFFKMIKGIGHDMHRLTDVFRIHNPVLDKQRILDMRMAPGGCLGIALQVNPKTRAIGFGLPKCEGGHNVLLLKHPTISAKFIDITLLAADMGWLDIPNDQSRCGEILAPSIRPGQALDLIICDGKHREASRLTLTHLALGLGHTKLGGTIVILLHKVKSSHTLQLLHAISTFSSVRLYKHPRFHAKRSLFYMLATIIWHYCSEAAVAIQGWRRMWEIAMLGTDDTFSQAIQGNVRDIDVILKNFDPRLAVLGKHIWGVQADALYSLSP